MNILGLISQLIGIKTLRLTHCIHLSFMVYFDDLNLMLICSLVLLLIKNDETESRNLDAVVMGKLHV